MDSIRRIALVGSGNAATQIGIGLKATGYKVSQVWSRKLKHARRLAGVLEAKPTDDLSKIDRKADLILISVTDDAISDVAKAIAKKLPDDFEGIIAHTSGFTPINKLKGERIGVFYPLQTFTSTHEVEWNKVPICVEGSDKTTAKALKKLAKGLSGRVSITDAEQRRVLHIAAVFAANYSNYMYVLAEDLLKEKEISFKMLEPLIKEVSRKSRKGNAWENQTGPARRGDEGVINMHLKMLGSHPESKKIYKILADSIKNHDS